VITDRLLERCAVEWRAATQHPFLEAVRIGAMPREAFDRWLVQDYLFVGDLLTFQARLLSHAPRRSQAVLAGGLVALDAELSWFEQHAAQRGLSLDVPHDAAAAAYRTFLERTAEADAAIGITALWALERAYLDAWSSAKPGAAPYTEFVEHWTTPEFATYVGGLADAVEAAAPPEDSAMSVFIEVTRLERDFWPML
jgi:thiaminase